MIKRKLISSIAAAVAVTALSFGSGNAISAIVCNTTTVPISVTNDIGGLYLNFIDGDTSGGGDITFNPYNNGAGLTFYWYSPSAGLLTGGKYAALGAGVAVGPAGTYGPFNQATAPQMADWRVAQAGKYVGLSFNNASTSATNYGWAQMTTAAGSGTDVGFPASVDSFCFQNDGTAINTGDTGAVTPTARVNALHFAPFANTLPGTAVSIKVNGTEVVPSVQFNLGSGYLSTPAVSTTVDVYAPPGSAGPPAITTTAVLAASTDYSIAAIGDVTNQPLSLLALVDDNTAPTAGNAKVRVVHAAPFAASLPATAVSIRLQDGTVVNGLSSVQFGQSSAYFELPAGSYNLKISTPDGATTLIDPAAVTLTSGEIVTLFAVGDVTNQPLGVTAVFGDGTLAALPLETTGGGGTFPPDENFDEVTAPALPTGWTGSGFTTVTTFADSAPNAAFALDVGAVSNFTLDTPSFTPLGATTLTFRHKYNLESGFDGAVLEISISGGAFADIVTAGGAFTSGGYTGAISSSFGSPISGRQAWSGDSGGFITSVVSLPSSATGLPTVLRFRTADDSSVAPTTNPGWWIDNLHLSVATLPTVLKSFSPASVTTGADSTLTITLANPTTGAATLTANLVDTLPAGLVATAATATTTCTGGTGATNSTSAVTLASGAVIPANGTCTITATVNSATSGSYVNTIPVGALQTSIGNNDTAASATLTVSGPPVAVITPSTLAYTLAQGASGSNPINIANTGGSNLTYSVSEGTTAISDRKPTSYKNVSRSAHAAMLSGQSFGFSGNAHPTKLRAGQVVLTAADISQMADNTPGDQGVSCGVSGVSTADNSWWRRFYFSEYPGVGATTNVSSVTISSGSTGPTGLPITINLYTIPHATTVNTIPTASLTPIGSATGTIDAGLLSVTVPVTGVVGDTAGLDLVVEYHTDGTDAGQFFPGANATPETHPTFLSSNTCGITDPTPASAIGAGFPNFHLTMVVTLGGTPPATCANPADIPWLSEAPTSGTVAAGTSTNVSVTANATGLAVGSYSANVCVATNDPAAALVTIPVTLTVTQGAFVPCSGGADEIFCDGFEGAGGGTAGMYTDRTVFLTHVATGSYENPFANATTGASPPLTYTSGGWAYTVDASSPGPAGGLFNDTGIISTNLAADSIVVTFTGDPVTAVGGNFWATDISVAPTGTDVTITLSDATTETFTSTGPTDFRGFTTAAPVTTITIDALDGPAPAWATMDNLIIGTAN